MFRYELAASKSSLKSPEMTLGKASLDMVRIEEDADNIRERLHNAESRLRQLSMQSRRVSSSSGALRCSRSPVHSCSQWPHSLDAHFSEIGRHLSHIQSCWRSSECSASQDLIAYEGKYLQLVDLLEEQERRHHQELLRMQAALQDMQKDLSSQVRTLETRHLAEVSRLQHQHKAELQSLRGRSQGEFRGSQASCREEQLIAQVELLTETLHQERQQNGSLREGERVHIGEICSLEIEIEALKVELGRETLNTTAKQKASDGLCQAIHQQTARIQKLEAAVRERQVRIEELHRFLASMSELVSKSSQQLAISLNRHISIQFPELKLKPVLPSPRPAELESKTGTQKLLSLLSDDKENVQSNNTDKATAKRKSRTSKTVSCDEDLLMMIILQAQQIEALL